MAADIPSQEPDRLRAGDTWRWTRSLADYPATTWTLKYRMKSAAAGFEISATASGSDHSITVAASTTTAYTAGSYNWIAWVESGSEKFTVDEGSIEVLSDYRSGTAAAALDDRSHAQTMVDNIRAWLESKDPAVAEYEIAGRRMKYIPIADLLKLRHQYESEVVAEVARKKLEHGENFGRRIQFRI